MATIRVQDNIFIPSSFDYYIIPEKIVYSNMTATLGTGWYQYDNVEWIEELERHATAHTFGFEVAAGGTASVASTLRLVFANAAQDVQHGTFHNVTMDIYNVSVQSRSIRARKTSIIRIDNSEFWLEMFNLVDPQDQFDGSGKLINDPKPLLGGTANISITISGATSGVFAWPLTDIDVRYDISTDSAVVGGTLSESATPYSDCSEILIKTNSWLDWIGKSIDITTPGSTQVLSLPIRFYNGRNESDDSAKGDNTGIVCLCNADGVAFTWTGSDCGTSFKGQGLDIYTIHYDANGGSGAPANQYKVSGQNLQLSSTVPTNVPGQTRFLGWSTSLARADAGQVDYQPGDILQTDGNLNLYASWEYLISVDFNGGYAIVGPDPEHDIWAGPISYWKKGSETYSVNYRWVKEGGTILGFNTSASATTAAYPQTISYSVKAPISLYAIWQIDTYTVRFHDGYTVGNDVIKTVTVQYMGSVPAADVPVEGQTYAGRVFKKPGPYHLTGWAGSYQNVTSDRDIVAVWDFIPIWIKVGSEASGSWVKYDPIES